MSTSSVPESIKQSDLQDTIRTIVPHKDGCVIETFDGKKLFATESSCELIYEEKSS